MKLILSFSIFLVCLRVAAVAQQGPGWHNIEPPEWTLPLQEASAPSAAAASFQASGISAQTMPTGNLADEITPEIQAIADGLRHDQNRIFDWVRNHIAFKLYYGVKKGAALTLLEQSGNDADTSALLVALLRASGIPARYVWGYTVMPLEVGGVATDWASYLKLTPRGVDPIFGGLMFQPATEAYLFNALAGAGMAQSHILKGGGLPAGSYGVRRCCVAVPAVGGGYTYLDPSLKIHIGKLAFFGDYASISGYNRAALLSEAGGTAVTNGIKNLDQTKIDNYLNARAKTFTDWAAAQMHSVDIMELTGGWCMDDMSLYPPFPAPFYYGGEPVTDTLPTSLFVTLQVKLMQANDITLVQTFFLPELKGQNLHIWFNSSTVNGNVMANGSLYLDDNLIVSEKEGAVSYPISSPASATISIVHPSIDGEASFLNQSFQSEFQRHGTYVILCCNDMSEGWLRKRQTLLEKHLASGLLNTSRKVKAESLNVMGLQWMLETERIQKLNEAMSDEPSLTHHRVGLVKDEYSASRAKGGIVVDVPAELFSPIYRKTMGVSYASSVVGSAMEHGVIAQLQNGLLGASTMSVAAAANAAGKTLYLATGSNWSSVSPLLSGYSSADVTRFGSWLANSASAALIPQSAAISIGNWQGYGVAAQEQLTNGRSFHMEISGRLNGGYSAINAPINVQTVQQARQNTASVLNSAPVTHPITTGGDPVDMASGHFTYQHTDLSIDGGMLPEGVSFTRTYHGSRRQSDRDKVGYGWTHNLRYGVAERSNVESALGVGTVAQSASTLLGMWVVADLAQNRTTAKDWAVCGLAANWLANTLTKNTVCITAGDRIMEFQRLPGGLGYAPPPGVSATLTRTPSTVNGINVIIWEVTEKNGDKLRITQQDSSSGETLSVEISRADGTTGSIVYYANSISATDYLGRWIQVIFDNTNPSLQLVIDSTGRTVTYERDAEGNLTGAIDGIGYMDRLAYDSVRHLTEVKTPGNAVIVRNTVFDAQDRVVEQFSRGHSTRPWRYFYAPGQSIAEDPNGGAVTYLFDERLRSTGQIDEEGRAHHRSFDSDDRLNQTLSPTPNSTGREYDSKHNLKSISDELGELPQKESHRGSVNE